MPAKTGMPELRKLFTPACINGIKGFLFDENMWEMFATGLTAKSSRSVPQVLEIRCRGQRGTTYFSVRKSDKKSASKDCWIVTEKYSAKRDRMFVAAQKILHMYIKWRNIRGNGGSTNVAPCPDHLITARPPLSADTIDRLVMSDTYKAIDKDILTTDGANIYVETIELTEIPEVVWPSPDKHPELVGIFSCSYNDKVYTAPCYSELTAEGALIPASGIEKAFKIAGVTEKLRTARYEERTHYVILKKRYYLTMIGLIAFASNAKSAALRSVSLVTADYLFKISVQANCVCENECTCERSPTPGLATSGVYLFRLGRVRDLRKLMKIPDTWNDNHYVYKYGRSIDITRREREHNRIYGTIAGVELEMTNIFTRRIMDLFIPEAELFVKNDMDLYGYRFKCKVKGVDRTELIIAPKIQERKRLIKTFDVAQTEYLNYHVRVFQTRINYLKDKIRALKKSHKQEIKSLNKAHAKELDRVTQYRDEQIEAAVALQLAKFKTKIAMLMLKKKNRKVWKLIR